MSSFTEFTGSSGLTTRKNGALATMPSGTKSAAGSYGRLLCTVTLIAIGVGVAINSV